MGAQSDAAAFYQSSMGGEVTPGQAYLAAADPDYMAAYQNFAHVVYGRPDPAVPPAVRELIVVALLAGQGAWDQLRVHLRRALRNGRSEAELLQALEFAGTACGLTALFSGAELLAEAVASHRRSASVSTPSGPDRVERNMATFRRLQYEVIAGGRDDLVESVFAPGFRTTRSGLADLMALSGQAPYPASGDVYDRFRAGLATMKAALGDQEREIEQLQGAGDHVWARWRIRATHSGVFLGHPPTGRRVEFTETGLLHFDNEGRIDEGWFLADELNLARQLGLRIVAGEEAAR